MSPKEKHVFNLLIAFSSDTSYRFLCYLLNKVADILDSKSLSQEKYSQMQHQIIAYQLRNTSEKLLKFNGRNL
jgi:hypothetical protein